MATSTGRRRATPGSHSAGRGRIDSPFPAIQRISPMFINPLYIVLVGPFLLLAAWASWRVRSTFARFASVGVRSGMTGAQAAAAVARAGGSEVTVERHQGFLSDHYDPRTKPPRLP